MTKYIIFAAIITIFLISGCISNNEVNGMKMESSAFKNNQMISSKYTCQGDDINPPLDITQIPKNTKSLALIVDDPDAPMGTWVHWVVWNIPPEKLKIEEDEIPGVQGRNDFGKLNYGGPCPPSGTHRYFFKLYALDFNLKIPEGSTKNTLLKEMEGHIIEKTELIGLYTKNR